jgi:hypothetical protein
MNDKPRTTPKGLVAQLKGAFKGYNETDVHQNLPLNTDSYADQSFRPVPTQGGDTGTSINTNFVPTDRAVLNDLSRKVRLRHYEEMADEPIFNCALDIHLSHALSADPQTSTILSIEATDPAFTGLAKDIMNDLGHYFNKDILAWVKLCMIYGAHYIRPYTEEKKGITFIESGWHTLAVHVSEYERAGALAGFTSEHLRQPDSGLIELAPPWTLVALKMPTFRPGINRAPDDPSGVQYSLFNDHYHRSPIPSQNYGTSMLHGAWEPYLDLRDALVSLRGSRQNASQIERLITIGMEGLTPQAASQQLNLIGAQLQGNVLAAQAKHKKGGLKASVANLLLPSLSGGKGGLGVETLSTSPDIQHIEDVMFHLKRACSALGMDVSLLGWGDMMSGGLGDGGFFRTSIQAAIRANEIRVAVRECIHRLIDIHLIYKTGKAFSGKRPYEVKFHSLNTAIEQEQASAMLTRSDYASNVATLLDMIEQGMLAKSTTFKNMVMTDMLKMPEDKADAILAELSAVTATDDPVMFESVNQLHEIINKAAQQAATTQINAILEKV